MNFSKKTAKFSILATWLWGFANLSSQISTSTISPAVTTVPVKKKQNIFLQWVKAQAKLDSTNAEITSLKSSSAQLAQMQQKYPLFATTLTAVKNATDQQVTKLATQVPQMQSVISNIITNRDQQLAQAKTK